MTIEEGLPRCLDAISRGDVESLEHLLRTYPSLVEWRDERGRSLLHFATKAGKSDISALDMLLKAGAFIDASDRYGCTPLHEAAHSGKKEAVRELLLRGAKVDARDGNGVTPLHIAALLMEDFTDLLLDHGADIDAADCSGSTPLMWSIADGNDTTTQRLLERGATANVFCLAGLNDVSGLNAAVEMNPQVLHITDGRRCTPLHWAARSGQSEAALLLLGLGSNVNAQNKLGETPLHLATISPTGLGVIRDLLSHGARTDVRDNKGRSPLHRAAGTGRAEIVSTLLKAGARADTLDEQGLSPLDLLFARLTKDRTVAQFMVDNWRRVGSFMSQAEDAYFLLTMAGAQLARQDSGDRNDTKFDATPAAPGAAPHEMTACECRSCSACGAIRVDYCGLHTAGLPVASSLSS